MFDAPMIRYMGKGIKANILPEQSYTFRPY